MSHTQINVRLDDDVAKRLEVTCPPFSVPVAGQGQGHPVRETSALCTSLCTQC